MRPLGPSRSARRCRVFAWAAIAWLGCAGRAPAQPPVTIPPPHSWAMLGLPRSVPSLSGRRGSGAPCDTGATLAPDRVRVTRGGAPAACLPNPAHETRAWCDLLDPGDEPVPPWPASGHMPYTAPPPTYIQMGYNSIVLPPTLPGRPYVRRDSAYQAASPHPLESSQSILRALERIEAREALGDSTATARLAVVDTLLLQDARLHEPAARARLLTARLERLRQVCAWVPDTTVGTGGESLQSALAATEEALEVAPNDALSHAWRAVLYDTRVPRFADGRWEVAPLGRSRALASLRHAIELSPDDPRYARLLARWLAESGDLEGARSALQACRAVDRGLVAIVDDLCRLPRFGALGFRPLDDFSLTDWRWRLGDALRRLGRDADHLDFRLRGWSWPDSAGAAEDALRQAWPGFHLFPVKSAAAGPGPTLYAQRVVSPQAAAAPATTRSSVLQDLDGGMSLVLVEHPAPSGGRPCCTLILVDWRAPD